MYGGAMSEEARDELPKSEAGESRGRRRLRMTIVPIGLLGLLILTVVVPQTRALWLFQLAQRAEGERRTWCVAQLAALEEHGAGPLVLLSAEDCDAAYGEGVASGEAPLPESLEFPKTLEVLAAAAGDSPALRTRLIRSIEDGGPLVISTLALLPSWWKASEEERHAISLALARRRLAIRHPALLIELAQDLHPDRRPGPVPPELIKRPCRVEPAVEGQSDAARVIAALSAALGSRLVVSRAASAKARVDMEDIFFHGNDVGAMLADLCTPEGLWSRSRGFSTSKDFRFLGHFFKRKAPSALDWIYRDNQIHILTRAEAEPYWEAEFRRLVTEAE